ncbi:MAG TPA: MazG nucleotide pyrophosphohydrolase domain-containing protein [Chloroflexota bacterium]|nr:MazG nucleotide pyrophosphohydrolase domain-containing protein [Chloroflexota bacterium]
MSARSSAREEEGSILDGIPAAMPALERADAIQQRVAEVGFDWPDISGVTAKAHEEIDELAAAATLDHQREELGDVLFALVNLGRRLGFSAELALQEANEKFIRRFAWIEAQCRQAGVRPEELGLEKLDRLWNAAKMNERPEVDEGAPDAKGGRGKQTGAV